ncbi:hypothetical protein AK830_g9108 [Neonectria ditissima]|uniref:Major facilitator superfamily (MFS) profile domain-containing protein n=1 Tax=Neonectria ditissima TaxID=78410 RepID=A0A0P7ASF5_9HYPO|nr:hypothetical protein AK830_g9108 [Neonectria ditissima]
METPSSTIDRGSEPTPTLVSRIEHHEDNMKQNTNSEAKEETSDPEPSVYYSMSEERIRPADDTQQGQSRTLSELQVADGNDINADNHSDSVTPPEDRNEIPPPPPDGGLRAWCVCLAGHLVFMNTWGWINSFGVFQTYYKELLGRTASEISWIGSITVFLLFFVGTLTGRLVDAGYFRLVFATGVMLQVLGVLATSLCTEYWHFLLAQGVCVGVGNGCLFCPVLAVLSTYFARRRALAMGIAACGSVTGGLVFPTLVRQLLPKAGFAWTLRAAAFIQLGTLLVALVLVKPRIKPRRAASMIDLPAFSELEYTFYTVGCFLGYWGVYFAFYYIASFSREALDKPLSYTESLNLLLILNGVGAIGRLLPAWLADHFGAINVFIPNTIAASVLLFCWIAVKDSAGLYAWAVVYGPLAAAIQSLFPTGVSLLTKDLSKIGVRMGMSFTIVSFAVLTGPPIAGAIIDRQGGQYWGAQTFAGVSLAMGTLFLSAAKLVWMRREGMDWKGKI